MVVDIDQWLHFLAVDSLVGNREGGLTTGKGDDYALYRGVKDQRFKLVPHDLDTVLDQGTRSGNPNLSIFTYRDVDGLEEFLSHPDIIRRYYAKFIDILENKFKPDLINPIIDRALMGVVNSDVLDEMKEFIVDRRRGVLEQIQTNYSVDVDLPKSNDGFFSH
ncbi:MAG: CotH kinase family protein [Verrucomicrobiales bacterium]